MTAARVVAGDAEVQADGFGVTDVKVAVRLGRKAGDDERVPARREIGVDDLTDEIARRPRLLAHVQPSLALRDARTYQRRVAGAVGIEPTNGRVRACCLTVWRRPNSRSRAGR